MAGQVSQEDNLSEWSVAAGEAQMRLDRWLVQRLARAGRSVGRARVQKLIAHGNVFVDGCAQPKGKALLLEAGQRVRLTADIPSDSAPEADPHPAPELPLTVLHEDPWLVIVDKPAGVHSHPLRHDERDTMVNRLVARYPEMCGVGFRRREAGLVHRLDYDTSGLLVAARDATTFATLRAALEKHLIQKHYLALCVGHPRPGQVFRERLVHDPDRPKRVRVDTSASAPIASADAATTEVLRVDPLRTYALVELRAMRARRHQVRAHMATHGHPLAGDRLYGGPALPNLSRHFLHASLVCLRHPNTGAVIEVVAPLPLDLVQAMQDLQSPTQRPR